MSYFGSRVPAAPHPLASAAGDRLEQYRVADVGGQLQRLAHVPQDARGARDRRQAMIGHRTFGGGLVPHLADCRGSGTDERQPLLRAARREHGVLRQEPVAGVQGLAVELFGRLKDGALIQIGLARLGRADANRHAVAPRTHGAPVSTSE